MNAIPTSPVVYDIVVAFECVLKRITSLDAQITLIIQKIAFAFTKMSPFVQIATH